MRKALTLLLATYVVLLGAAVAYGDAPVITYIPDVIMGDANPADGQTSDGYYIYSGLDIGSHVLDHDNAKVGFSVTDNARNVSIAGKSRLTVAEEAAWGASGNIPATKNVITSSTIRATSDLWDRAGADVAKFYKGDTNGLGPMYGFKPISGTQKALVTLMAADDGHNKGEGKFWINLLSNTANQASRQTTDTARLPKITPIVMDNPGATGNGFTFVTAPTGTTAEGFPFFITVPYNPSTLMRVDTVAVPETAIGFGYWGNNNLSYGVNWQDGVVRVTWTVWIDVGTTSAPGVRSRIFPGDTSNNLFMRTTNAGLRIEPNSGVLFNTATIAGGGALGTKSVNIRHYWYGGTLPQLLAYKGSVLVAFDTIDMPSAGILGRPGVRAGKVYIDRVALEILSKPQTGDLVPLLSVTGAALASDMTWVSASAGFDVRTPNPSLGLFNCNRAAGVGLNIKNSAPDNSEQRLFGIWMDTNIGVRIAQTERSCVRVVGTIKTDASIAAQPKPDLRLRLFPWYTVSPVFASLEAQYILNIPGQWGQSIGAITTSATLVIPSSVGTGTPYEIYMDTPVVPARYGQTDTWGFALDAIDWYHPNPAVYGFTWYPKTAVNVTLTGLTMEQVLNY